MVDAGTLGQQMPRQEDDLLRRVKDLERLVQQTQSAAAGAQNVANSLTALLANQVTGATAHAETSGFGLNTTQTELLRATVTVPTGYTRALVIATSAVTARNNQSGIDISMGAYADINGVSSTQIMVQTVFQQAQGSVSPSTSTLLTGLTAGSTFYARVVASIASLTFAGDSRNRATVDTSVIFLK